MVQQFYHKKEYNVLVLPHIQCLHLIHSEVTWVLVSSGTQVLSQIIFDPDYLPNSLPFLMTMKTLLMKLWNSRKIFKLFEFRIFWSRLFHSITAEGKFRGTLIEVIFYFEWRSSIRISRVFCTHMLLLKNIRA